MLKNNEEFQEIFGESSDVLESLFDEITDAEVEELGIKIDNQGFAITNDEQANFFLRRIEEIRGERDKINNTCNNEIERFTQKVNSFRNKETNSLDNTERFFATLLENYASAQLANSKKKSIKLPFGTLAFKTSQPKFVYDDEKVMSFIKERQLQQFIRTKEEINKKDLKAALTVQDNGSVLFNDEPIEGINVTPGEQTFSIK